MGYLDNSSVTIDAILTTKGRELLAQGGNDFKITKFALGDDEIDYTLWNSNNGSGTAYYGIIIENMPILEATPDESQALRSKLVTLPKTTVKMPTIGGTNVTADTFTIKTATEFAEIKPTSTVGGSAFTETYTVTISDGTVLALQILTGAVGTAGVVGLADSATPASSNNEPRSITGIGSTFKITPVGTSRTTIGRAVVTITGNLTGATKSISYTVNTY